MKAKAKEGEGKIFQITFFTIELYTNQIIGTLIYHLLYFWNYFKTCLGDAMSSISKYWPTFTLNLLPDLKKSPARSSVYIVLITVSTLNVMKISVTSYKSTYLELNFGKQITSFQVIKGFCQNKHLYKLLNSGLWISSSR